MDDLNTHSFSTQSNRPFPANCIKDDLFLHTYYNELIDYYTTKRVSINIIAKLYKTPNNQHPGNLVQYMLLSLNKCYIEELDNHTKLQELARECIKYSTININYNENVLLIMISRNKSPSYERYINIKHSLPFLTNCRRENIMHREFCFSFKLL